MRIVLTDSGVVGTVPSYRFTFSGRSVTAEPKSPSGDETLLAITPSGRQEHTDVLRKLGALDGVMLDEKRIAALLKERGEVKVALGAVSESGTTRWQDELSFAELNPPPVEWPKRLIWSEVDEENFLGGAGLLDEQGFGSVTLSANQWGIGVASNGTGIAAVVRPGESRAALSVRVPCQPEAEVFAEATALGMIVTLVIEGRESALLAFDRNRKLLHYLAGFGFTQARAAGELVLVYDANKGAILLLDPALEVVSKKKLSWHPSVSVTSPDGRFAFADDAHVALGKVTKGSIASLDESSHLQLYRQEKRRAEVEEAEGRYEPQRMHGPAALGFGTERVTPRWKAGCGSEFELEMTVRSTGGSGQGLTVTASGPALKHASLLQIECGDDSAEFETSSDGTSARAELSRIAIPPGVVYPLEPQPANATQKEKGAALLSSTQFTLRVRGVANEVSRELLTLAIAPNSNSAPPMKMMAALVIERS